jgi:hypothetical protein
MARRRGLSTETVGDPLTEPQLEVFSRLRDEERRARAALNAETSR